MRFIKFCLILIMSIIGLFTLVGIIGASANSDGSNDSSNNSSVENLSEDVGDSQKDEDESQETSIIKLLNMDLSAVKDIGIDYSLSDNEFTIFANLSSILESIPKLKKLNIINPDFPQALINLHEIATGGIATTMFLPVIIKAAFDDTPLNKIHFKVMINVPDDYGNDKEHLAFQFDFNRKMYDEINWDNFKWHNIFKIALNIHVSPWYQGKINELEYN